MSDHRDAARRRDHEMRAYLLGTLEADSRASLEEEIFEDEATYDALLDARYDLLDDYARDALPAAERDQVARLLQREAGGDALTVADLLARRPAAALAAPVAPAAATPAAARRDYRLLAAAAVAVLAVGAAARFAFDNTRLRGELSRATVPTAAAPAAADRVARIDLAPQTTRSAAAQDVAIPPSAAVVELVVPLDEAAPEYRAILEGRDGVLWTARRLTRAPDGALHVWLAASQLVEGSYELLVYGGPAADAPLVAAIPIRIVGAP